MKSVSFFRSIQGFSDNYYSLQCPGMYRASGVSAVPCHIWSCS